jgi:hypothetical protein
LRPRLAVGGLFEALLKTYADAHQLTAICDVNQSRMDYQNRVFQERFGARTPVATYLASEFERKIRATLETYERTGRKLRVTFNYRYSPARLTVKDLLMRGVIGNVRRCILSGCSIVSMALIIFAGAHCDKRNSGGSYGPQGDASL